MVVNAVFLSLVFFIQIRINLFVDTITFNGKSSFL